MPKLIVARVRRVAAAVSVWSACSVATVAVPNSALAQQSEKLGTISFPTSGSAAAQPEFIRGMLLYYSFEYGRAADAFRAAQKADPSFALAYAGEALTFTHQVWDEQDINAARAALNRLAPTAAARRGKAGTERERMYMDAVEILYGDGPKPRRDTLFTIAIERIERAFPDDDDAQVIHALGLLGWNQGVREFTTYMQAGAIAEGVLRRYPDHPGAAHFVIHAFDDPIHAPLGLWAARLYSKIAPAAPHAQHMTSHIFVALGMWDDVISQNVIAAGPRPDTHRAGHYTWWLNYGYVQAGRHAEASRHLETMRKNVRVPHRGGEMPALIMMRAHYVLDSERWNDPIASWDLGTTTTSPFATPADRFVAGYVALKRGDTVAASTIAADLAKSAALSRGGAVEFEGAAGILAMELRGAALSAQGKHAEAIAALVSATTAEDALPFEFGPPMIPKPAHELAGEVLLAAGQAADAQAEFQKSLARTPLRPRSLIGLARAASAAGDKATAESAVNRLRAVWHAADKDIPELAELSRLAANKE